MRVSISQISQLTHNIDHHIKDRNKYLDMKGYSKVNLVLYLIKLAKESPYNICK